jgi:hypothetical protein
MEKEIAMTTLKRIFGVIAATTVVLGLSACGSSGRYYGDDGLPTRHYSGELPAGAVDSDVYVDPSYGARGDGVFRPRYRTKNY